MLHLGLLDSIVKTENISKISAQNSPYISQKTIIFFKYIKYKPKIGRYKSHDLTDDTLQGSVTRERKKCCA